MRAGSTGLARRARLLLPQSTYPPAELSLSFSSIADETPLPVLISKEGEEEATGPGKEEGAFLLIPVLGRACSLARKRWDRRGSQFDVRSTETFESKEGRSNGKSPQRRLAERNNNPRRGSEPTPPLPPKRKFLPDGHLYVLLARPLVPGATALLEPSGA